MAEGAPAQADYSGTPLARKLGLKPGMRAWRSGMPASIEEHTLEVVPGLAFTDDEEPPLDYAHLFTASRCELEEALDGLRRVLAPAGMIWVSWPKKAAKVPTDITEDVVREVALRLGLVDVKVCAVDDVWSGLKLVIRKALRG
jgi:hypothetical protein